MTHGSLFSGIGGFDLAAQWMGWDNLFHVEQDEFCQQVLKHHFPQSQSYGDIKAFDATDFRGRISVLSGGFPCQPFSAAGKRQGVSDDRYLWPEMFRIIREVRPRWVVAENVRGLTSMRSERGMVLDEIIADLEDEGYEVFPTILGAASVNAPHRRDRIWIVAYADHHRAVDPVRGERAGSPSDGCRTTQSERGPNGGDGYVADTNAVRLQQRTDSAEVGRGQGGICREGHQLADEPTSTSQAENVADTNCEERERRGGTGKRERQATEQGRDGVQRTTARPGEESAATNSDGAGTRQNHGWGGAGQFDQEGAATNWADFPTVPPVCGGDDGLPKVLDGITFSKWRRQSIKAYGNAIVPQVALQIFKAIRNAENPEA